MAIEASGLRLDGTLGVSFQRFLRPAGALSELPGSLGALPVGPGPDATFVLPVADDEAFWVGLSTEAAAPLRVSLLAELAGAGAVDALSGEPANIRAPRVVEVARFAAVPGIAAADGSRRPFARADGAFACRSLRILLRDDMDAVLASATVALADYATFARLSGRAPPPTLDPEAGFKGYRLP